MSTCEYGCGLPSCYMMKNGKNCCSKNHQGCSAQRKKNSKGQKKRPKESFYKVYTENKGRKDCTYCNKSIGILGLDAHMNNCYMNPKNLKLCPNCGGPIKKFRSSKTCSHKCANFYFKDKIGENRKYPDDKVKYSTLCFRYHEKKCIICDESQIVCAHHYDFNHNNNDICNLVPLCPTHHMYVHSRLYDTIKDQIDVYVKDFIKNKLLILSVL